MTEEKKRTVLYAREVRLPESDPEPFIYLYDKWENLEKVLETDADIVAVAFPEVLGDTYTEMVINLGRIAESGKTLVVIRSSPFLKMDDEI